MARIITKELALKICKKLRARDLRVSGPHEAFVVEHGGRSLALIYIRRGSNKEAGHDHVPKELHLTPHQTRLLAQCSLSRDDWLRSLREKGVLPPA